MRRGEDEWWGEAEAPNDVEATTPPTGVAWVTAAAPVRPCCRTSRWSSRAATVDAIVSVAQHRAEDAFTDVPVSCEP